MVERSNERMAWFNGEFMPENQVKIPFRDLSWVYGDGCFDMTRSFNHKLFKVKEQSYDRNWVTESERGDVSWRLSRPAINSRKERYAYVEPYNHSAAPARYDQ
jgi:hypothetical protein